MRTHPADAEFAMMIETYGWAVALVQDAPSFGYTVGLVKNYGHPEIFICGLSVETIHALCNDFGAAVKNGAKFADGKVVQDFFEGDELLKLVSIADPWKSQYLGRGVDYMNDPQLPALQAIWSSPTGVFPGDPGFPKELKVQFFLDRHDAT